MNTPLTLVNPTVSITSLPANVSAELFESDAIAHTHELGNCSGQVTE
jgi:hypothetical protein